ncbi:MAG: hypothetical protein ACU85E_02145 [Gammaproteobacteria bacterium]
MDQGVYTVRTVSFKQAFVVREMFMRIALPAFIALFVIAVSVNASALGSEEEFEGRYRVGTTTCTVKPIKMAFEVRWAKGKGAMVFFHEWDSALGRYSFVSEKKNSGVDRFVFSNRRLMSGVFIRSDGKRFQVDKLK